MTFEEADNGQANVYKNDENCAVCVVAHELRLRGFDITALPYDDTEGSMSRLLSENTRSIWLTAKGKQPEFTLIGGSEDEIIAKIDRQTQPIGSRYHLGWDNKYGGGHIVTAERTDKGLFFYDAQRDTYLFLNEILTDMGELTKLQLLRVDRLLVNARLLQSLTEPIVNGRNR